MGTEVNGEFIPTSAEHYEITPDQATMASAGETRGLEPDEAALLHRLLDTISVYCAQSVVWWEQGQGTRVMDEENTGLEKPAGEPDGNKSARMLPRGVAEVVAHPIPRP